METIALPRLALMLLPVLAVGWIYYRWCGRPGEVAWATVRMTLQLLLIGYALVFLLENDRLWIGAGVVLVMVVASSAIAVRPLQHRGRREFAYALLAIGLTGSAVLALVLLAVLDLKPFYQPQYAIPLAGMTYSNAMNTVSLAGERFFKEMESAGAPYPEARATAFRAALIPQINSFLAVGLVALPGMMTGQILSGVSPLIAVRYQIMIMALVFGAAGLAAAGFLHLLRPAETK